MRIAQNSKRALKITSTFVGFLWLIWGIDLLNSTVGILPNMKNFGIVPRTMIGLLGIPIAPFIHVGYGHLLSNTLPLLLLGFALFSFYRRTAWSALAIVVFGGGFLVTHPWVFDHREGKEGNPPPFLWPSWSYLMSVQSKATPGSRAQWLPSSWYF